MVETVLVSWVAGEETGQDEGNKKRAEADTPVGAEPGAVGAR